MKTIYADNNVAMLKKVESFLRDYCKERNEPFEIDLCTSPYELLEKLQKNVYDFIMLTVVYPKQEVSGLDISTKTRKFAPYTPTIFIEATGTENAELNFVYPKRFELKPFSRTNFYSIMDDLYLQIFDAPLGSINVVTLDKHTEQIKVSEIVYVESTKKIISIYLYSGRCIQINGPMKKFVEVLSDFMEFIFPHRSFAVNAVFVSGMTNDNIYLKNSNKEIPIAKGKAPYVKAVYSKYFKMIIKTTPEATERKTV